MKGKKVKNDGSKTKDLARPRKKMQSKDKAMTIRYDAVQEKQILEMQEKIGEKTMSKAFLKAPIVLKNMMAEIIELKATTQRQNIQIEQMKGIINAWASFNNRLEEFVKKRENKEELDDDQDLKEIDDGNNKTLKEFGIKIE